LRQAYRDVRTQLAGLDADIVHAHSSHAGLIARAAARRIGRPSVYTAHGWPFQRGAAWTQRAVSLAGEFVGGHVGDAVICLTKAEAELALRAKVVSKDRLWVVPNGISDIDPSLRRQPHDGDPALVMVARFAPPKRQADLIRTMSGLLDLPWSLSLVGDGPESASCRTLGARRLGERVRFLGHRDDVTSILAASDIAVLGSRYEGFPISLLEAMRAGLCCVASDLPGVRVLLSDPPVGRIASGEQDLSLALRELIGDRSTTRALGDLARSRFERSFAASAMELATRAIYEAVLARRSS
jgi:glycosyltransferase involved in cell wall biosynthesis